MEKYKVVNGVGIIPKGTVKIEGEYDILSSESSFEDCESLISIVIPDSVTEIGRYAFQGCTSLTDIVIPDSVTEIGEDAFSGCRGLQSIVIPDSVTKIGKGAFSYCTGLTSVCVNEGNTIYDSRDNCKAIIETTSNILISGCSATVIPDSVTEIGEGAFKGCTGLTSVIIPNSATEIRRRAFEGCTGLTSIVIGNSVTEIGNSAFEDCTGLTSIVIPDSMTEIGDYAFEGCTSLTDIVISNAVTQMNPSAFRKCSSLRSIVVKEGNPRYDSRNNCNAIIETASNELILGCRSTIIPESVTKISDSALQECTGLTSLVFPKRLKRILHQYSEMEEVGIYRRFNSQTNKSQIYIKEEGSRPCTPSEYRSNYDVDGDDVYYAMEADREEALYVTYEKIDELDNIHKYLSEPSKRKKTKRKKH